MRVYYARIICTAKAKDHASANILKTSDITLTKFA